MKTYIVRELENRNSFRPGAGIQAASLRSAKRWAEQSRFFQNTVLVIEAPNGARLAVKENGKWEDCE